MDNPPVIKKKSSFFILFLALLGSAAAGYSLYEHTLLHAGAMKGASACNIGGQFNCDAINKSEYSTVLGVPLAGIGLAYYLVTAIGGLISFFTGLSLAALGVLFISATFSVGLSLYLFYISKFVVGYFCLFCMAMYIANVGLFITSYRAVKGSIWHAISQGLFAPGELVMNLMTGSKRVSAWIFLILSAVAIYGTFQFPALVAGSVKKQLSTQASAYLLSWKKEPVISLSVRQGSAIDGDYTSGAKEPVVEIVEYSDFECPACRMFYPRVEKLLEKYKDKISFTAKNFPLDKSCNRLIQRNIHIHSCEIAAFVRCGGEQGKFWEAYHQAFTDTEIDKSSESEEVMPSLYNWASGAGLDAEAIKSCVSSGRQLEKIKAEVEEGISLNLESTPTLYINGRKTNPAQLEDIVEALLH